MEKELEKVPATRTRKSNTTKTKTLDDIRPSDRVSIDNLCDWEISFISEETNKDILIPGSVKNYRTLTVAEVDSQVKIGNVAFCGDDGFGAHAPIRINDSLIREYVFQEPVDPVQLTEENVKNLLAMQDKKKFMERLNELVVRESDKKMIVRLVERIGKDDVPSYQITAIEKISGIKFYD